MRNKGKLLISFLLIGILISCSKEKTIVCYPSLVYENDKVYLDLIYNANQQLVHLDQYEPTTGQLNAYFEIKYDGDGRLDYLDFRVPSSPQFQRRKISYNSQGQPGGMFVFNDSNTDGYPEELLGAYYFYYNSSNQIDSLVSFDGSMVYQLSMMFEWTGDNLTKLSTTSSGDYIIYEYDNYRGVYEPIKFELFVITLNFSILSYHNEIREAGYNAANVLQWEYFNTFTYNSDNLPETEDATRRYEYDCIEIE